MTRTSFALLAVESAAADGLDGFLLNLLSQHVSVIFYSEMEERVAGVLSSCFVTNASGHVAVFLTKNMEGIMRRTPKSDISKLVAMFGDKFSVHFEGLLTERSISFYSNVITARHSSGHGSGAQLTIEDLRRGLDAAEELLDGLEICLNSIGSPTG